jgi:hypothetical protein
MNKKLIIAFLLIGLPLSAASEYSNAIQMFCVKRLLQKNPVPRAKLFLKFKKFHEGLLSTKSLRMGKTGIDLLDQLNERFRGHPVSWNKSRLGIGFDLDHSASIMAAIYRKKGKALWDVETQEPTKQSSQSFSTITVELSQEGTEQHNNYKLSDGYKPARTGIPALDELNTTHSATVTDTFWNSAGHVVFTLRFQNAVSESVVDEYNQLAEHGETVAQIQTYKATQEAGQQ